jgi:serine/threonine protein kinase
MPTKAQYHKNKKQHTMHGLDIVFQDLNPDDINFDRCGMVKLFDFGLAKEQKPLTAKEDSMPYWILTVYGTRRHVNPLCGSYLALIQTTPLMFHLSCICQRQHVQQIGDMYSFRISLWEMCLLEKPFQGYSSKKHLKDVFLGREQPKMDSSHTAHWPGPLQWLMKCCLSANVESRHSFSMVKQTLEEVLGGLNTANPPEQKQAITVGSHGEKASVTAPIRKLHQNWLELNPVSFGAYHGRGSHGMLPAQITGAFLPPYYCPKLDLLPAIQEHCIAWTACQTKLRQNLAKL